MFKRVPSRRGGRPASRGLRLPVFLPHVKVASVRISPRRGRRDGWKHLEKRRELDILQDYLNLDWREQGIELARTFPQAFQRWARGEYPEWLASRVERLLDEDDYDAFERLLEKLPAELLQRFLEKVGPPLSSYPEAPSFLHLDFKRRLPRQWLVHFSDHAGHIACEGFTKGVERHTELGLTTHFAESYKEYGGYNFAYRAADAERQGRANGYGGRKSWKYGTEIVIFTAPAVLAWHHGDEEDQAIFWGADARQLVYVEQNEFHHADDGWVDGFCVGEDRAGRPLYCSDDLEDVIDWVDAHWQQYKHLLSCGGTQPSEDRERRAGRRGRR